MLDATRYRWWPIVLVLVADLVLAACSTGAEPPAPTVSSDHPIRVRGVDGPADQAAGGAHHLDVRELDDRHPVRVRRGHRRRPGYHRRPAGFTSGTGDLYEVVQRYAQQRPDERARGYLPALKSVNGSDSTEGLDGFPDVWKQTSQTDPLLNQIQDQVADELYFQPAMIRAQESGVRSALGQLIFWDTIVQHGEGEPDRGSRRPAGDHERGGRRARIGRRQRGGVAGGLPERPPGAPAQTGRRVDPGRVA